jgi:hypothetical protein
MHSTTGLKQSGSPHALVQRTKLSLKLVLRHPGQIVPGGGFIEYSKYPISIALLSTTVNRLNEIKPTQEN